MSMLRRALIWFVSGLLGLAILVGVAGPASAAVILPAGFQEQVVFSGLSLPMNIEFANDGRVFVAEKGGRIKVFDNLADPTPTVFADLSTNVHNQWDRGLLGLALAPNFPTNPWVYVLYTYDAPPGQTAPVWNDVCANANDGTCVVTGRLSRLQANGNVMTGTEQVLIHDWCQQYPSHSIGDIKFGGDGMLYVTGGDGASFSAVDYGQLAGASNPCADPPGGAMTPPTAAGGALRSQDVRTLGDPTTLDGALLRLDPTTGAAAAGNPLISSSDLNARRIVSHGFRNPFRFTFRPGTNEAWVADVGWNAWEEINRITNPATGPTNYGWPCFEGNGRMSGYDNANLNLCETLYTANTQSSPYFAWPHSGKVVPNEACPSGSSSASGAAFYPSNGGSYPAAYRGALFVSDYSRNCIWAMLPSTAGGLPDPANIITFGSAANGPVDLAIGPGGELYYADPGGNVRRIRYFPGNQPPTAAIAAVPVNGPAPLSVAFSGVGSSDPDPADAGRLTYQWDFTNDGTVDSTSPTPSFVYTGVGNHTARLTVTDTLGATGTTTVTISSGNSPPTAVIDTPSAGTTWKVGDPISFTGHATDPQQGNLPGAALDWRLRMQHCSEPAVCHTHVVQEWTDVASGSFTAPDHEYPSYLELEAIATDAGGLTHSVVRRLDPKTVNLTFATNPTGLQLTVGSVTQTAPFTRTVIQGSLNSVSAVSPQGARTFSAWSDGGAATHTVTAPTTATTYTATYTTPPCADSFGYTCTSGPRSFVPADQTVLALTGDDAVQQVALPFPMRFYGTNYPSVWVDTNGLLTFAAPPASTFANGAIPSAGPANLAVYPFWDDLLVDASASVRTAVTGTAPNRSFVVEWRNVRLFAAENARVTFEVVLAENGTITVAYAGIDADASEQGGSATVGIENGAGTVALSYAVNQPVLRSGNGITFTPPA